MEICQDQVKFVYWFSFSLNLNNVESSTGIYVLVNLGDSCEPSTEKGS